LLATLTLTPQTVTWALPAFTGALTAELPPDPFPDDPLLCAAGAQALDWLPREATLALTPKTVTLGLAAFTGALTVLPPPDDPEVLPPDCVTAAPVLV
jgi:hypothetical protein